jgi:hypothetical protein
VGLFSKLIPSPEQRIESALEFTYVTIYQTMMGITLKEARSNFAEELACVKDIIAKRGEYVVPDGYGSFLISNRHNDPKIGAHLAKIEAEGVRESDVLWFWNMSNLERLFYMRTFECCVGACWFGACERGMTSEQARAQTRKVHPFHGDPDDTSVASGEDRPVPVELRDRIALFIERRAREDPEQFRALMDRSSSFNAIIRRAIRAGRL